MLLRESLFDFFKNFSACWQPHHLQYSLNVSNKYKHYRKIVQVPDIVHSNHDLHDLIFFSSLASCLEWIFRLGSKFMVLFCPCSTSLTILLQLFSSCVKMWHLIRNTLFPTPYLSVHCICLFCVDPREGLTKIHDFYPHFVDKVLTPSLY